MRKDDIPNRCPTGNGGRTKTLVAIEPRAYRTVIGRAIQILRPQLEVTVVEPEDLQAKVARLDPALVISGQPKPATSDGGPAWVEFRPYDELSAKVYIGGRRAQLYDPNLDDVLTVVDEAESLSPTPPELPAASCLPSYGNGGKTSG
jgi:hypothetical protein